MIVPMCMSGWVTARYPAVIGWDGEWDIQRSFPLVKVIVNGGLAVQSLAHCGVKRLTGWCSEPQIEISRLTKIMLRYVSTIRGKTSKQRYDSSPW